MGESLLMSAASLLVRMQPAMPTPYRNGYGSSEKEREQMQNTRQILLAEGLPYSKRRASATPVHEGRKSCSCKGADPTPEEACELF
jgi:hypothetical protein